MRKIYIVKVLSQHEVTYAISSETDLKENSWQDLENKLNHYGPEEIKQEWLGEKVMEVEGSYTEEEYVKIHDKRFPDSKLFVVNYEKLNEAGMLPDKDLL